MIKNIYFGIYSAIIVAVIFIYMAIYAVKGGYEYGDYLRKQCSPVFMEKERGEHHAYNAYLNSSRNNFMNGNMVLVACVSLILMVYIIHTFSIFVKSFSLELKGFKHPLTDDLVKVPSIVTKLHSIIPAVILLILIIMLVHALKYGFGSTSICNSYILSIKEIPVNFEKDKAIYRRHVRYIWLILITVALISVLYNPIFINDISTQSLLPHGLASLYVSFVIIAIVIFILFELIIEFQEKISYDYGKYRETLNSLIAIELKGPNSQKIIAEIEKNIVKDERDTRLGYEGIGAPTDILSDARYKNDLYKYLMHVINNYDIMSIKVPQDIKPLINPMYLGGENIISLKLELVSTHYRHSSISPIVPEDLQPGGLDDSLLRFLRTEIRSQLVMNHPQTYDYINLLNTHVVNNPIFKNGNPLTKQIIDVMTASRQSTIMRDSINKYSRILNILLTIISILISFYIYHFVIYKNSIEHRLQTVAFTAFIVLLFLTVVGWVLRTISL